MISITRILLLIFALSLVSCGNKVPLKLPDAVYEIDFNYERN
tara:strand:- start:5907 stop:6032 length:126 start_codon:yes stop_codon:yes gene_type:complete